MSESILNLADSYKYSHASQYPKNMVSMYDYMESRGGVYPATVFVGMQYYLEKYLTVPVTMEEVWDAQLKAKRHGIPFDLHGWKYIVKQHKGLLPIEIKAIKEGSLVPTRHVLFTVESTDTNVPWVAGFVETLLLKLWYPTTVATKSYYVRKMLERYGSPEWAQFAYHNFGDRGSTSVESAAIGGFAHYTQFMGTDSFNSLDVAADYYQETGMPAYSVFATEHSTTTSHGRDGEEEFVYNQLLENPDSAIMSFVADSYDVYAFTHFCTDKGSRIRELVESRPHQKLVLRPDSGDAIEVVNRMLNIMDRNELETVPASLKLFKDFGVLWSDGITPEVIENILSINMTSGFAAENFVFGSGGDIMQNVNRDTQKFAMKCSSIRVPDTLADGMGNIVYSNIDVYKDPITDPGKTSKRGKVTTLLNTQTGEYVSSTLDATSNSVNVDALHTVFLNGVLVNKTTLSEVRKQAK